ncbi:Y-family DNA polymerase [Allopusillimonas ginsengisoli]|uniref:Y-family DNA polymerase n=1 Tax=Allopusillimonas ginsengisoli TaxID=453575 RepID=UPI001022126C|nr:DNA polymerase Y family protein [Allopusillimonas ginsengisoli]TEA71869.1 DNA polymerase Y family protein [Allopusillimonas ginsengisoli]
MPLWISLYLPTHRLDVTFPHWSADTLAAVLAGGKICACTPAAYRRGIRTGMSAGTAQGLAPKLNLAQDDAQQRTQHLHGLALSMLQYTPCISCFREHAVLMEVSASLSLFKGPRQLCRRIRATLRNMGTQVWLGVAPTALGAWVLSRQSARYRRALSLRTLHRRLDALPVRTLPAVLPYADWLEGVGCRQLGQLRKLPRQALQQRSSPQLMQEVDAAYGLLPEGFSWFEAPLSFRQRHELIEHLEHSNAIMAVAVRLIEQLCGWLQARQQSVRYLELLLHHEKGRHARPPTSLTLRFSESAWQPNDFSDVLREHLHTLILPAPVISLELAAPQTTPRPAASGSLFPEPAQWQRQEHRLLDLLQARLGAGHVLCSKPVADYRPEQANLWQPLDAPGAPAPQTPPPRLPAHSRPFWLLASAQKLRTKDNYPVYQNRTLRLVQGPERLESGWWSGSGHEQRDYFIAQDTQGARYWIYREREAGDAGWFLQGIFG